MTQGRVVEREEELSVVCIKVVVKGKWRDKSTERGSVHDEKWRAENRALGLGEHHKRKYERTRGCYHIKTLKEWD